MAIIGVNQATEAVKRSRRTLIVAPENPTADQLSAAAGILAYLVNSGKMADAIIPNLNQDKVPPFIANKDQLMSKLPGLRDLKITLDVSQTPIHELSYDVKDSKLDILLTPKAGEWLPKDIKYQSGEDRYDLIIAIGYSERASLAACFGANQDMAYRLPTINIDKDAKNEFWAPINLVDLTAGSITEVAFDWLMDWSPANMDNKIATALLAGMMWNTHSFRSSTVMPQTLSKAAKLLELGADREAVALGLWRTRKISTLKLWGRALTRLEQNKEKGIIWTTLSKQDILDSGTNEARLDELMQELITYSPDSKLFIVFVEHDQNTSRVALFAQPPYEANALGRQFGLDGTRFKASGAIAKSLLETKEFVIEKLSKMV
ncbi:MAG: hypothetical protein WCW31_03150 [Patescibacteria group bacterium]